MDAVNAFNSELQSLYETKPPISKAKMTLITRSAMKAIKLYKHVVQSVEKFIQKCKPEYKVPGLYVIDSIVRQSRHQYTAEKDVFAPRFSRNIKTTFLHLFNCSQEDKSKIVRVLNLWQKNNVFSAEVIQPLLDLAASVSSKDTVSTNGVQSKTPPHAGSQSRITNSKSSPTKDPSWLTGGRNQASENSTDTKSTSAAAPKVKMDKKLFDYDYGEDEDDDRAASASPIVNQATSTPAQQTPLPNLESLSSILSNPEVLRQLHTLQQQMAARQQQQELEEKMRRLQEMKHQEEEFDRHLAQTLPKLPFASECELQSNLGGGVNSVGVNLPSAVAPPGGLPPSSVPPPSLPPTSVPPPTGVPLPGANAGLGPDGTPTLTLGANMPTAFLSQIDLPPLMVQPPPVPPPSFPSQPSFSSLDPSGVDRAPVDYDERTRAMDLNRGLKEDGKKDSDLNEDGIEVIDLVRSPSTRDSDHRRYHNRSRSKDRYRRSRSHSRSRRRRSRSSDRDDERDRDYDRKQREMDREKERERKKKGLPMPRRNHLTVCSTTLWIGHLSKLIHEDQLSNIFGEFGDIVSINLIPPRGCAFVCMNRRQDAMKALHELKHYKIQSKSITVAWAPGKGMKEKEWKDYWEVEHGASFIPWNKISPYTNFELLEEGGMLDQDTFPEWLKEIYNNVKKEAEERKAKEEEERKAKTEELPPLPSGPHPPPQPTPAIPTSQPDMRGPPPQPPPPTPLPPPPMGMLPPPPFPLQPPGLLGPMGMSMPTGLVGPLGVPPPIMVPQQMIPRMPPPFNAPPQSFGLMDGMPPPPMPNAGNPFGPPMMPTVNNTASNSNPLVNNISNKDPTEMDVEDESEEELPKKDEVNIPLPNLPLPLSPFPGLPPLPNLGSNQEGGETPKLSEDTDMRMLEAEQNRKRKWNGEEDSFRHRNNRWPERDRRGGNSPLERRNDERPQLLTQPPVLPPDFPPFTNNRHGVRGPEDEDVYPAAMIDFPPRDFQSREFPPRDFPPRPPTANHFFNPRGPLFGPRGPPPGHSPLSMRPPRHPVHPGMRGVGDGRGGWGPPPPQQQGPPPRGARFPLLHPPPMVPNRRPPGERKSRWGEPVDQPMEDMMPIQLGEIPDDRLPPGEIMHVDMNLSKSPGPPGDEPCLIEPTVSPPREPPTIEEKHEETENKSPHSAFSSSDTLAECPSQPPPCIEPIVEEPDKLQEAPCDNPLPPPVDDVPLQTQVDMFSEPLPDTLHPVQERIPEESSQKSEGPESISIESDTRVLEEEPKPDVVESNLCDIFSDTPVDMIESSSLADSPPPTSQDFLPVIDAIDGESAPQVSLYSPEPVSTPVHSPEQPPPIDVPPLIPITGVLPPETGSLDPPPPMEDVLDPPTEDKADSQVEGAT